MDHFQVVIVLLLPLCIESLSVIKGGERLVLEVFGKKQQWRLAIRCRQIVIGRLQGRQNDRKSSL